MPFELQTDQGITIAVLSGTFDKLQGEEFATEIERKVPKGGQLIVDGSNLKTLTQQGVLHLITVQRWASVPERKRLLSVGFNSTIWRAIVENGSDFFFESKTTLDEALKVLGAAAPSLPLAPAATPAQSDAPSGETAAVLPRSTPPSRAVPKGDPWLEPLPATPPPRPFQDPLPSAKGPASPYGTPLPVMPTRPEAGAKGVLWLSLAAGLVIAAVAAWWLFGSHKPVLTLSAASTDVEEDGKEVDEVTARVQHGRLVETSWSNLPKGLYFEPPGEDSGTRTYTLRGKAEPGATTTTVQLEATNDDGQLTAPVSFTVNVKEKPMSWELNTLQSLGLKVGTRIWMTSKFLVNVDSVSVENGLPPGLTVERIPGHNRDWQLAGTPTAAGSFPVAFMASSPTGKRERESCTLEVAAIPQATIPGTTAPDRKVSPGPDMVAVPEIDDGLRRFLLDRIENLPKRYSDKERENLRTVVGTLRQARLIDRVVFEHEGQTEISPAQSAELKAALQTADNTALFKDPACQIVVVGYASKTGNPASNIKISKLRAYNVNRSLKETVGHNADLCGDYGPTNVVDQAADEKNRAVEVYAGTLEPSSDMQANAERFKRDFNREHGLH